MTPAATPKARIPPSTRIDSSEPPSGTGFLIRTLHVLSIFVSLVLPAKVDELGKLAQQMSHRTFCAFRIASLDSGDYLEVIGKVLTSGLIGHPRRIGVPEAESIVGQNGDLPLEKRILRCRSDGSMKLLIDADEFTYVSCLDDLAVPLA